jgi:5-formyltetrahydrofolate cyclo-ligase
MTKSECRQLFSEKRKQLSDSEIGQLSQEILTRLIQSFDLKGKTISVFLPIKSKKEINTYPLLDLRQALNIRFGLPVADFSTNTMSHFLFEDMHQIQVNAHGIPEPIKGIHIPSSEIDVVITPLLCFDASGFRVGYGKGFYDQFLATCKPECQFIGLSFFDPIDKITDANEMDVPLHYCVTPHSTYSFRSV